MSKAVWDLKSQFEKHKDADVFDCMIAEFLLSFGRRVGGEEKVFKKYGVENLSDLAKKQKDAFSEYEALAKLFYDVEMPLVGVLWKMEQNGILLDVKQLESIGKELAQKIEELEKEIKKHVGHDININSSVQVGEYLAEKEGVSLSKTKTGRYATGESELRKHENQFPIIEQILKYRELSKLLSTYVKSLIDKVDGQSRIHTTYHQTAVNTGRLASSDPNMQNIPVSGEYGLKIKSCFMAPTGKTLVSFDYSQQELRILAHLTGEEKLIEAFNEGRDVHKQTASEVFDVSYDEVTKQQRSIAKMVNFGIIYGMSGYGMSSGLNISVEEAQGFIDRYYTRYPKIKTFYDEYFKKAKVDGYVETLFGRRRYVFEYPKQKFIDNATRRVLLNFPIQGSAADLMKKAMVDVAREIVGKDDAVKLLLQIHDDLVFEIDDKKKQNLEFVKKVKKIMCDVYPLSVPVEVDAKIGRRWGEMEEVKV